MGTTVQKLQRILETKTGFKNLITEKGGVITETTTFHEYIDEARKLMEGGKVVVEETSATAVPNSGVVENIYFNTSLTPEEVDKIITDANLEWQTDPSSGVLAYGVYYADSGDTLIIMKFGEENPKYIMMGALPSVGVTVFMPYLSIGAASLLGMTIPSGSEEGWIHDPGLGIPLDGIVPIKGNLMSEYNGMATGIDNEALKKLISSTPFSGGGKQPVPNSGYVDTIKFNTNLSPEEVDQIITDANLSYINAYGMTMYPVFMDVDTKTYIAVVDATSALNTGTPAYQIINLGEELLYSTPELTSLGASVSGWNSNFNDAMEVKAEAHSDIATYATQNDKLVDLVYIDSEPFRKELTGTYEAVTVDVTENSEVDLTTYWDNQQMPIKVNVNIEAGASGEAIEIATEEELDAAMVEENIGKFYKYTGETTVKYEKDAVYVVQDADNPIIEDEIKSITTEVEMDAALVEENIGKFFLYAGETCDKYVNNMIYTVQDKDNPIIDGPAIIEGGATGTAVPNSGYVDTVYFNTALSPEEVDKIITDANLDFEEGFTDLVGYPMCMLLLEDNLDTNVTMEIGSFGPNKFAIVINMHIIVYLSEAITAEDMGFEPGYRGWNPELNGVFDFNIKSVADSMTIEGSNIIDTPVGVQNEALKQIISTTPFDDEPFYKELSGTYEPVEIEVTENSEIDLTTYMDEQKMPIKINVNVEGGSGGSVSLKTLWNYTKTTRNAFYGVTATDLSSYLKYEDTSNVTDMYGMFDSCTNLTTIPELDTSNVTNTGCMFNECASLTTIPELDTSNVTNMFCMFSGCTSLTNVPDLDTSNVTVMNNMFDGCTNLVTAPELDTSNVTKMNYMFRDCTNLVTVPKLDMNKCTSSSSIFANCVNLTNVTLLNIRETMYLGSGTSYGQMLTAESLINSAFECINAGSNRKLYIGSTHGDKLNNVYVKFKDPSVTTIPTGEKGDVVLCESTDEGAMTLYKYMSLKKWSFSN